MVNALVRRWALFTTLAAAGLMQACASYPPEPPIAAMQAETSGVVYFQSSTPYDFVSASSGRAREQVVEGDLFLPQGSGPFPAVVMLHASDGVNEHYLGYANRLAQVGVASFIVNSFTPRGVSGTYARQVMVTEQTMTADAFAALNLLRTHPLVDASRVGVIGFGKGGTSAILSSVDRVANYVAQPANRFDFAAAFYPFCGLRFDSGERVVTPTLVFTGSDDDWAPADQCVDIVNQLDNGSGQIAINVYPDAPHFFDRSNPVDYDETRLRLRSNAEGCILSIDNQGRTVRVDGEGDVTNFANRVAFLRSCAAQGAHAGLDAVARDQSWTDLQDFLRSNGVI